ncbi:glycosyltransferase family 2 protein [Fibrella aestuarina]|uniref:glycosyltransferase family 2 protein n=1 Tax=Fibrella aestuarina TaxID=651143 RepID=UPI00059CA2F6|nr:glycosyltransferase family 2 protein [Fibrella aestuarina]
MNGPLITVITVTYQAEKSLEETIKSVINQAPIYEYLIIDGGSTDGTVDIIKKYNSQIKYWLSEKDNGIYEAMNKGIDKASGQWIYFLGSDDQLCKNSLTSISKYLTDENDMVFGDVKSSNQKRIKSFLNKRIIFQNTLHHQGAFYSSKLFDTFRYDSKLKILSDYELNLYIYIHKLPVKKVNLVIAECGDGGASSNIALSINETNIVRSKLIKSNFLNTVASFALKVYYNQKEFRNKFNFL